jgi:hypothetical protein
MAKKKPAPKKLKKKRLQKPAAAKKIAKKGQVSGSAKTQPKAKAKVAAKMKTPTKNKLAPKRPTPSVQASVARGSQDVETVRLKPKSRVARAGTGAGDLQGISIVEDVDSESADELLEEGQAFEASIVSGVERAGDAEESEVVTHEVLEDDVPKEYDEEDRP